MPLKNHWDRVYATKSPQSVSWYQSHADQSLRLIRQTGLPLSASIIDVGGGASTLADDLLHAGYRHLTVLDLSRAALAATQARLGNEARQVTWLEADVTRVTLPARAFDLWHDRAVFHFLTGKREREAYVAAVMHAVKPGGHVIVATFAEDGPLQCSGLPVVRYAPHSLHAEFGRRFTLLEHEHEEHHTPSGSVQKFIYCCCRKEPA